MPPNPCRPEESKDPENAFPAMLLQEVLTKVVELPPVQHSSSVFSDNRFELVFGNKDSVLTLRM